MGNNDAIDDQIAQRLKALRLERGLSLDDLAKRSGISRATLSRLENAEVSATAQVLGKLCTVYGLTLTRLIRMVEEQFPPVIPSDLQEVWIDPETGFRRRSVSPPAQALAAEALDCTIPPNTRLSYDGPPRPGMEHHLIMLEGAITITVSGATHALKVGDTLRYQLYGPSLFETGPEGVRYILFMV